VITAKHRGSAAPGLFVGAHVAIVTAIVLAWTIGMVRGPIEFVALHVGAAVTASISIAAILLVRGRPAPAWDPVLRLRWREREAAGRDSI
jgi:hypothetical protein